MTHTSILELVAALRPRYRKADKEVKGRMLWEFCLTTGYHRKAAIRLFNHPPRASARRGRPRRYRPEVVLPPLTLAWEAAGYICAKRLAPFMGELLDSLIRHHEIQLDASVYQQLVTMSPATIDRLLRPVRQHRLRHPHVSTSTVASLAHKVATHTFADFALCLWGTWKWTWCCTAA